MTTINNVAVADLPDKMVQLGVTRTTLVCVTFEPLPPKKTTESRWKRLAEKAHKESPLLGASQVLDKYSREFRDEFAFKHDLE